MTPIALTGAPSTNASWVNASRNRRSLECACRNRYSTASASATRSLSASGVSACRVRAETSVDSDAMPGVSISVSSRSRWVGQVTTSRSTSPGAVPPRSTSSAPPCRRNGRLRGSPWRGCRTTRGWSPRTYQVTIWVHSPASVGASSSLTRALSMVDLPAFTRPAIATRSGPASRARISCRVGAGLRGRRLLAGQPEQRRRSRRSGPQPRLLPADRPRGCRRLAGSARAAARPARRARRRAAGVPPVRARPPG